MSRGAALQRGRAAHRQGGQAQVGGPEARDVSCPGGWWGTDQTWRGCDRLGWGRVDRTCAGTWARPPFCGALALHPSSVWKPQPTPSHRWALGADMNPKEAFSDHPSQWRPHPTGHCHPCQLYFFMAFIKHLTWPRC